MPVKVFIITKYPTSKTFVIKAVYVNTHSQHRRIGVSLSLGIPSGVTAGYKQLG